MRKVFMLVFQNRDKGGGVSKCSPVMQLVRLLSEAQETPAVPFPLGPLAGKSTRMFLFLKVTVKITSLSSSITVLPPHQASAIVSKIIVTTNLWRPQAA